MPKITKIRSIRPAREKDNRFLVRIQDRHQTDYRIDSAVTERKISEVISSPYVVLVGNLAPG
jgi:hypothetical protein